MKSNLRRPLRSRPIQHRQLRTLIQIPILLRRIERRMRLPKTHRQKKRLILHLRQHTHRFDRHPPIVVSLIRHVVTGRDALLRIPAPTSHLHQIRRQRPLNLRRVRPMIRIVQKLIRTPGPPIPLLRRVPVVKNLPHTPRRVALLLEPKRQGRHLRIQLPKMRPIIPKPQRVRPQPRQQRRP